MMKKAPIAVIVCLVVLSVSNYIFAQQGEKVAFPEIPGKTIYRYVRFLPECLVAEYSGEKVESALLQHQLLGGVVWEGPMDTEYDVAGFKGLNDESVDWGMTMGITFIIGKK